MNILKWLLLGLMSIMCVSCIVQHTAEITPDPEVDKRLQGVWRIIPNTEDDDDEFASDLGIQNFIIFSKVAKDQYKCLMVDHMEEGTKSTFPETIVSTKKHKGVNMLLFKLDTHEREEMERDAEDGELLIENFIICYTIDKEGVLSLKFIDGENFEKIVKMKNLKFAASEGIGFTPLQIEGDEDLILDLYTDPEVLKLMESFGKYKKVFEHESHVE